MFSMGRMQIRHFRHSRQNGPSFWQGTKARSTKSTVCATPTTLSDIPEPRQWKAIQALHQQVTNEKRPVNRKGTGSPHRRNQWPRNGNGPRPRVRGTDGPFNGRKCLSQFTKSTVCATPTCLDRSSVHFREHSRGSSIGVGGNPTPNVSQALADLSPILTKF